MLATILISLFLVGTCRAASMATLQRREHRQQATLHRDRGTLTFFGRHRWLVRARATRPIALRALRFARAELVWTVREFAETRRALQPRPMPVTAVICQVFGSHCAEALAVARCESGFSTTAENGQYFGLFQMGSAERARFGGSSTDPLEQTRAAFRYFSFAGWGPWECRP